MIGKTIPYTDLDDNPVEDTFWFHLSRAEMAEMALAKEGKAGGFDVWIKTIRDSNDGQVIIDTFKQILLATVGERSEDNKRFVKSEEIRNNFLFSNAYSVFFMEMVTDPEKMAEFINGIVPKDMKDDVAKAIQSGDVTALQGSGQGTTTPAASTPAPEPKDDRPDWLKDPTRVPSEAELRGATPEQMMEAFRRKSANAGPVTHEEITGG